MGMVAWLWFRERKLAKLHKSIWPKAEIFLERQESEERSLKISIGASNGSGGGEDNKE